MAGADKKLDKTNVGGKSASSTNPPANPENMDVDEKSTSNVNNVTEETRVNEVERVLKCKPQDWYGILGVDTDCKPLVARRAALRILLLIKDRFETGTEEMRSKSNEATKLVTNAVEGLKAGTHYVELDENGHKANFPPESQPYTPSDEVKKIYEQATGSVLVLFSGVEDTSLATLEIHQYNENIRDIIQSGNSNATVLEQISGFIDLKTISSYIQLRKQHEDLAARDTSTLSPSERVKSANSKRILGQMGGVIDQLNQSKGYPSNWNWDKQKHPGVWIAKPSNTTKAVKSFPPGQTSNGDTILGYLPAFKLDGQGGQVVERCSFVIEDENTEYNRGNIKIASWEEVGSEAGQLYLDQPEEEKLFVPHSQARYCTPLKKMNFLSLLGFWADWSPDRYRWGRAYCWIELQDGTHDIVTKGCFENIVGSKERAWDQITDLYDKDESMYIWRNEPVGRRNKSIREGPYGPVTIRKRKLIDNGPQLNQQEQTATENVNDTQPQNSKDETDIALILARLELAAVKNTERMAQMESQNATIQVDFKNLVSKMTEVQV